MKRYTPTYYANNIFEVNPVFFHRIKTNVLLLDLDNTLDNYKITAPSKRVVEYINQLKGYKKYIEFNNYTNIKDNNIIFIVTVKTFYRLRLNFKQQKCFCFAYKFILYLT